VRGRLRTRLHVHMSRTRLDILPLAESVRWRGKLLPRYGWYMLSGAVCDVGQFALYKLLWTTFGLPTMAWTAAYVLSIAMRQETHKVFVFGHYEGAWYKNLWRFYCVYFLTVATSMPVNLLLVRLMAFLPHQLTALGIAENTYAYFGTTVYTGIFSYLRLKANWRRVSVHSSHCERCTCGGAVRGQARCG